MKKKVQTIISVFLTGMLMFTLSGCGGNGNSDGSSAAHETSCLASDKLAKYAADQGASVFEDQDEFIKKFIYAQHKSGVEVIDGIMTLTGENLETLFTGGELNAAFNLEIDHDPAITKAAYYYIDGWEDWGAWWFQALAIDFESSAAAEAYGEDLRTKTKSAFEDYSSQDVQIAVSEGNDGDIRRTTASGVLNRITAREGVYIDESSVLVLAVRENNSESADQVLTPFCEAFQIHDPQNEKPAEPEPEPAQEYSGNTKAYIINPYDPTEDTSNGYEAIVYKNMDSDPPVIVNYGAEDVYKPSYMYIYLDGVEVKVDELDERTWGYSGILKLNDADQITNGVHTLEFVQYVDDDPAGEQRFYQSVEFTIEDSTDNN